MRKIETDDQIAKIMLLHGTPKQKAEALAYCGAEAGFKSKVMLFFWEVPVARMWVSNLDDAKKSSDMVLQGVNPFWRMFCRVEWVDA